jgi:TonB-dependent Receptor Plug Domain
MNGKNLMISLIFLFAFKVGLTQMVTVKGFVRDSMTAESLISCYITNDQTTVDTDINGYFEIKVKNDTSFFIQIGLLGYKSKMIKITELQKGDKLNIIYLSPILQDEVVITSESVQSKIRSTSQFKLSGKEIKRLSSLAGEADVMQALHFKSGFQPVREGFSGVVARGGLPDQNLLMVNGVRIYNYTHLFGFLPFINGDMIKDVNIFKSGFPAKYGGRSSSVIDMTLYEGSTQKTEIDISAGILMSKLTIKMPLIKDKWGLNMGGRVSNLNLVNLFSGKDYENKETASAVGINIHDFTISTKYNFSPSSFISGFVVISSDKNVVKQKRQWIEDIASIGWENHVYGLKFNQILEKSWVIEAGVGLLNYSNFQTSENKDVTQKITKTDLNNSLLESTLWIKSTKYLSNHLSASVGIGNHQTTFNPLRYYDSNDSIVVPSLSLSNNFAYISLVGEWKKIFTDVGLRYDIFKHNGVMHAFQPRFSIKYKISDKSSLTSALDVVSQNSFLISSSNLETPLEMWVPMDFGRSQNTGVQYSLGFKTKTNKGITASFETYIKKQSGLVENKNIYTEISAEIVNFKNTLSYDGKLNAYGFETTIEYEKNALLINSSYSYTRSTTSFGDINMGNAYPSNFLRPHAFTFHLQYKSSNRWTWTLKALYLSGHPFTAPVNAYYSNNNDIQYIFKERNNGRYPNYIRIDVGIEFLKSRKSSWSFSIYNITGRRNPFHIFLNNLNYGNQRFSNYYDGVNFTLLPSLSYSRKII